MRGEIPRLPRFSLAALLIFVAVVCVSIGQPRLTWTFVVASLYLLVGGMAVVCGWRVTRYRVVVRLLTVLFGAAMLVAGTWVFVVMLSR